MRQAGMSNFGKSYLPHQKTGLTHTILAHSLANEPGVYAPLFNVVQTPSRRDNTNVTNNYPQGQPPNIETRLHLRYTIGYMLYLIFYWLILVPLAITFVGWVVTMVLGLFTVFFGDAVETRNQDQ